MTISFNKKIRVLVLDDSEFFCEMISLFLEKEPGIEVVGTALDAQTAFRMAEILRPDVITVDIEMPIMDGIEFTKHIIPINPIPIVILSAIDSKVFEAMAAGAVDYVLKPDPNNVSSTGFISELITKIKIAAVSKVGKNKEIDKYAHEVKENKILSEKGNANSINIEHKKNIVAIGASTGGTEAITKIIKDFHVNMPGIIIAQHIPAGFSKMFAERLNNISRLKVKEAENGDAVIPGWVYVAPGEFQTTLEKRSNRYFLKCVKGEKNNGHAPSVDVLFNSVAKVAGKDAIGAILTGMGKDGANGILEMKNNGAYTIGQDETTSVIYGMPWEAFKIGALHKQLAIEKIAMEIIESV